MQDGRINYNRASMLGCSIDQVDMRQTLLRIGELIEQGDPAIVITLNAEIIYRALENPKLRSIINRAALVTPDGVGVIWAGKILGLVFPERVTGIDLLHVLCGQAAVKQWRIFLLGAAPQVAEQAAKRLMDEYPGLMICGFRDGYFSEQEEAALLEDINGTRPDIVAVALGSPKQEYWMDKHQQAIKTSVMLGVGGSLDVLAGIKKRAPDWVIRMNLEWLYRLICEPSRWRRQLVLPMFVIRVIKSKYFDG